VDSDGRVRLRLGSSSRRGRFNYSTLHRGRSRFHLVRRESCRPGRLTAHLTQGSLCLGVGALSERTPQFSPRCTPPPPSLYSNLPSPPPGGGRPLLWRQLVYIWCINYDGSAFSRACAASMVAVKVVLRVALLVGLLVTTHSALLQPCWSSGRESRRLLFLRSSEWTQNDVQHDAPRRPPPHSVTLMLNTYLTCTAHACYGANFKCQTRLWCPLNGVRIMFATDL
jgi:hypothetical protein